MSGVRRRETYLDFKTAFGPSPCGKRGPVSLGNRPDDRQAKAMAVRVSDTFAADLLERLQEALDLGGRHHRTGVVDQEGGPSRS